MRKRYRQNAFFRHVPTQESVRGYRFLQPVCRHLDHHALWQFNRRSIAGGLAVGLFFSVATPVAQIPVAVLFAILCRVNLPVAVFGTLFSNPFTTPAILYGAYRLGAFLVGHDLPARVQVPATVVPVAVTGYFDGALQWLLRSVEWVQSAGLPLAVGMLVVSVFLAIAGYAGVMTFWRLQVLLHLRARRRRPR